MKDTHLQWKTKPPDLFPCLCSRGLPCTWVGMDVLPAFVLLHLQGSLSSVWCCFMSFQAFKELCLYMVFLKACCVMLIPLNHSAHQHPKMVKMVQNLDLLREAHWRKKDNEIHSIKELILGVLPRTGALKPGLMRSICSCLIGWS